MFSAPDRSGRVPNLLEMILGFRPEVMDRADPKGDSGRRCYRIQAEKGRGPVATSFWFREGTLRIGASPMVGNTHGRIKAMTDYKGRKATEADRLHPSKYLGPNDPRRWRQSPGCCITRSPLPTAETRQ